MSAQNELQKYNEMALLDHETLSANIIEAVKNGEVDPLDVHLAMKRIDKIQELVGKDKEVKEAVLTAARKHRESGQFVYKNAKINVQATHTWYDYSNTNDLYYERLLELQDKIKAAVKEREEWLKTQIPSEKTLSIKKTTVIIEELPDITMLECGEEVIINPPVKMQSIGVKTSFIPNWQIKTQENEQI